MDNIPEKFLNEDGTLNSESLIKSYTELEKKMGTMISVPNENATDEDIMRVCKLAQADEFIQGFPDKYDTYIEQGGTNK